MWFSETVLAVSFLLPALVSAQLSGPVGPLTTRAAKRTKVCNVLNYGGVASKTADIGPSLLQAFTACKSGGTVYVPPGDYGMSTWVTLNGGNAWALQLDGIIYRTGTDGGNMIMVKHATDFEMYSSTSKGAMQGYGYVFHKDGLDGARLLRLFDVHNFSVHDIALVDAPAFHLVLDTCADGEVYNMVIYGGNKGGLDGLDVWGTNIHIHDVEVSNKDECVTVKSPASHLLIENIYCNWSGGSAIGSLGVDVAISNVIYRNIYTHHSNQMMMIKSNGGSGSLTDCQFNNFIGHSNAWSLDLNSYWTSLSLQPGNGVLYNNLTFNGWRGTAENGNSRAPVNIICPAATPCTDITVSDFAMWTDAGTSEYYKCQSAYGKGACLSSGAAKTGQPVSTMTIKSAPTGYSAAKMPNDLKTGFAITASIPIPTIGTTYFPGLKPVSTLLGK